jgi:hypothetical protein
MSSLNLRTLFISLLLGILLSSCGLFDFKPPYGFSLLKDPLLVTVTLEQGESKIIDIEIARRGGFKEEVNVTLESSTLTASPLTIPADSSSGTLTVTAKADAGIGASTAKIIGTSGTLSSSSSLAVTVTKPNLNRMVGKVQGYTSGIATLEANVIGQNGFASPSVGTGIILADGSFEFTITDTVKDEYLTGITKPCAGVTITPSIFKIGGFIGLTIIKDNLPIGRLLQTTNIDTVQVRPVAFTVYAFVDQNVNIQGTCQQNETTTTFNVNYKKGWNLESYDVQESSMTISTVESSDLPWLFESFDQF